MKTKNYIVNNAIEPSSLSTKKLLLMYYFFQKTVSQKASFPKFISPMNLIMRIVILEFQIQGITGTFTNHSRNFFWELIFATTYFKAIFLQTGPGQAPGLFHSIQYGANGSARRSRKMDEEIFPRKSPTSSVTCCKTKIATK